MDEEKTCFILTVISNEIGDSFDYKLSDTVLERLKASCELGGIEEYYDTFKLIFSGKKRIPGDANDDTKVDVKDITVMSQYIAHWNVTINLENADVNGDGVVTVKDVTLVKQKLAKWNVELV